jgi:hypothetical protein
MSTTENKRAEAWTWFKRTSTLIGMPIVASLLIVGAQRMFFTVTCEAAGWRCEYAFGASDAMAEYMGQLVAANPNSDLVAVPRKQK